MNEKNKKAIFWVITLSLPFLFFILFEVALRVGGYQKEKQDLFIEAPNTPDYLIANAKFIRRYFPDFVPEIAPNAFRKEKTPDTFRVFVFGGSSTEGFPYNFYNSFADQLEQKMLLNTRGRTIEVINLGMTAVNSYVIRDLSGRVLEYDPDAVIIYAGHNEFYGSFGAASTQFGSGSSVRLKHLILYLKNWRTYQLLENFIGSARSAQSARSARQLSPSDPSTRQDDALSETGNQRTMMATVIRESDIPAGGETFQDGMLQFETNLGDILATFQRHDIPVLMGTVASNLKDQAPLTDSPDALDAYEQAHELYEQGAFQEALEGFEQAKELDGTRFRAPSRINTIIREQSRKYGVNVVDIQQLLRDESESGIEDNSLFIDHLHPNDRGHKWMAHAFFDAIATHPRLDGYLHENTMEPPSSVSRFEKAYAEVSIARLLVGYPFQKNVSMQEELAAFDRIYQSYLSAGYVDSIAAVSSREQVFVPAALTEVIAMAHQRKDTMSVVTHSYDLLKWQLRSLNLIESSIDFTLDSGEQEGYLINMLHQVLNDGNVDPRYLDLLASLYLLDENTDQAGYWLERTARYNENAPRLLYNYSRYYLLKGDTLKAAEYYRRFLGVQQQARP